MKLTVYRHGQQRPFYVEFKELSADDFERVVRAYDAEDIDGLTRNAMNRGNVYISPSVFVVMKGEALREVMDKVGNVDDAAYLLGVSHHLINVFKEGIEAGDFDAAARYVSEGKNFGRSIKIRRDAKESTIRGRIERAVRKMLEDSDYWLGTLTLAAIDGINSRAESKRSEYSDYVLRAINGAREHFESQNASKAAEIRERMAGYEAMLKEARGQIQAMNNAEVIKFVKNDGNLGNGFPIAPEILEKIKANAKANKFFNEFNGSPFSVGSF